MYLCPKLIMKIDKGITEGFRRASLVVGSIFSLITFFLTILWQVNFFLIIFWTVAFFFIGLGLVRLLGWILSGFFKFD